MADAEIKSLIGAGFWYGHRISPWWEKLHGLFRSIYVVFLIIFGFSMTQTESPACLPVDGAQSDAYNEGQGAFVSSQCSYEIPWFHQTGRIRFAAAIGILCVEILLSGVFPWQNFSPGLKSFLEAEKKVSKPAFREKIEKWKRELRKRTEPSETPTTGYSNHDDSEEEIRRIFGSLWRCEGLSTAKVVILREMIFTIAYITAAAAIFIVTILADYWSFLDREFDCLIAERVSSMIPERSQFHCALSSASHDTLVLALYLAVISVHILVRISGLMSTVINYLKAFSGPAELKLVRMEVENSRKCIFFLASLCSDFQGDFAEFVKLAFSRYPFKVMLHYLYNLPEKPDFVYLTWIASVIDVKGRRFRESDILTQVIQDQTKNKKWRALVMLLNALFYRKEFDHSFFLKSRPERQNAMLLSNIVLKALEDSTTHYEGPNDLLKPDTDKPSALYYAFKGKYGMKAAEFILQAYNKNKKGDKKDLMVKQRENDPGMDLKSFVEKQNGSSFAYPFESMKKLMEENGYWPKNRSRRSNSKLGNRIRPGNPVVDDNVIV